MRSMLAPTLALAGLLSLPALAEEPAKKEPALAQSFIDKALAGSNCQINIGDDE